MPTINDQISSLQSNADSLLNGDFGNVNVSGSQTSAPVAPTAQANGYQFQAAGANTPVAQGSMPQGSAPEVNPAQLSQVPTAAPVAPVAPAVPGAPQAMPPGAPQAGAPMQPIAPPTGGMPQMPTGGAAPTMPQVAPPAPIAPTAGPTGGAPMQATGVPGVGAPITQTENTANAGANQPVNPAEPAPAPAAAPAPTEEQLKSIKDQKHVDDLMAAQTDPAKLAAIASNKDAPDYIRRAASEQALGHLTHYAGTADAQKVGDQLIADSQNPADPRKQAEASKQLANAVSKPSDDEGSYLKAYLLHRFGLADLSKQEQIKLGAGSTMMPVTMPDGTQVLVRMRADGVATSGVTAAEGRPLTQDQLRNATQGLVPGGEASKSLHQYTAPDGTKHIVSVITGKNGVVRYRDDTDNKYLASAPAGLEVAGHEDFNEKRAMMSQSSTMMKLRADNANAVKQGLAPIYSEEQIQNAGRQAYMAVNPTGSTATVAPNAPAGGGVTGIGTDLSEGLRSKIVSAGRSNTEQQALWDESVAAGRPGKTAGGMPIAKPGTSQHEVGNALDLPKDLSRAERQELAQKGYYQPMGVDSVHWEKITPTGGATSGTATTAPKAGGTPLQGSLETQAQQIADGIAPVPTGMGANNLRNQALIRRAYELNPNLDPGTYKVAQKTRQDFTTGKQGDTVRSMNVAVDHLDTLKEATLALNNGNLPLLNHVMNEYSRNTGSPAVTNFDGIKSIVGSEVAKAVSGQGGSALGDREEIRKEINAANSPQQLMGVIHKYQQLMGGQLKGLKTQYEDSGLKDFDRKLTPRTQQVINSTKQTRSNW